MSSSGTDEELNVSPYRTLKTVLMRTDRRADRQFTRLKQQSMRCLYCQRRFIPDQVMFKVKLFVAFILLFPVSILNFFSKFFPKFFQIFFSQIFFLKFFPKIFQNFPKKFWKKFWEKISKKNLGKKFEKKFGKFMNNS